MDKQQTPLDDNDALKEIDDIRKSLSLRIDKLIRVKSEVSQQVKGGNYQITVPENASLPNIDRKKNSIVETSNFIEDKPLTYYMYIDSEGYYQYKNHEELKGVNKQIHIYSMLHQEEDLFLHKALKGRQLAAVYAYEASDEIRREVSAFIDESIYFFTEYIKNAEKRKISLEKEIALLKSNIQHTNDIENTVELPLPRFIAAFAKMGLVVKAKTPGKYKWTNTTRLLRAYYDQGRIKAGITDFLEFFVIGDNEREIPYDSFKTSAKKCKVDQCDLTLFLEEVYKSQSVNL